MYKRCPICNYPLYSFSHEPMEDQYFIDCYKCGEFSFVRSIKPGIYKEYSKSRISNLSGWVREHQHYEFDTKNIIQMLESQPLTTVEKSSKLFKYLIKEYPTPGTRIPFGLSTLATVIREQANQLHTVTLPPKVAPVSKFELSI